MSLLDQVFSDFKADVETREHYSLLLKTSRNSGQVLRPAPLQKHNSQLLHYMKRRNLGEQTCHFYRARCSCISLVALNIASGRWLRWWPTRSTIVLQNILTYPNLLEMSLKIGLLRSSRIPDVTGTTKDKQILLLSSLVQSKAATQPPVNISSSILSLTDSNMRDRVLSDILKRVGMQDFWINVGKQAAMKLALNQITDVETTKEAPG